jgi:DNA-binding MarR family transcriptional regulator
VLDESPTVYRLIRLAKDLDYFFDGRLANLGLRDGEERLLAELWREDGLSQSEISERLITQVPVVIEVVRRLERKQLVRRRPDPEDRRVTRVYLTGLGRDAEQSMREVLRETERTFLGALNARERGHLAHLLTRIHPN